MLVSEVVKEHPPVNIGKSMMACLIFKQPIKVIQPIPNSQNKRVRRMEMNLYAGLDKPIFIMLSDEETADEDEKDEGSA